MVEPRGGLSGLIVAALLLIGFALKGLVIEPPSVPWNVRAGDFDTHRAIGRLQRILGNQRAHSVDTASDDAVRDRLIAEIRAIGLQPDVHEATNCTSDARTSIVSCAHIHNVVALIPGRAPGPALLLNAHYDSTPTGPGASDDGLGVATLLETAFNLRSAKLQRPVLLLFNEGEEFGLNGSAAFMRSDPLARAVDTLINIDSRGVTGPALMFETSDPNGPALSVYAQASKRPYANSLSTDFAKLIPNTTDAVEFKHGGWRFLNFAIVGNETRYHSPGDTIAALDQRSLHHVGSEVLTLARIMGAAARSDTSNSGKIIFTDIGGRAFIHLPLMVGYAILGLLVALAFLFAWRDRALTRDLLIVAGAALAGIACSSLVAILANLFRRGDFWRAYPLITYLAIYSTLLFAMAATFAHWHAGVDRKRSRSAAWLLILVAGGALSLLLPGATIFFLVAPAIAMAGVALQQKSPRSASALIVIAAVIQFIMFAEMLALIETLLIDGPLWSVTPLAALAALPFLVELEDETLKGARTALVPLCILLWVAALALPRSSVERPAFLSINYFRDADHNRASWAVGTKEAPLPSGFSGQWHEGTLPFSERERWIAEAPLTPTPEAGARVIDSRAAGKGRRLKIALSSGGSDALTLRFPSSAKLLGIGLPTVLERSAKSGPTLLRCSGRSCDGLVIEALVGEPNPIGVQLFSTRFALPPAGDQLEKARPAKTLPQYAPDSTITLKRMKI